MGKRSAAVYAAGHFLVDLACAFAMLRWARPAADWRGAVLLYNFLAFAGQAPLGLLADRLGDGRRFACAGCVLAAAAYAFSGAPTLLAAIAGLGNALFHVGGGLDTLNRSDGRAGALGVFVSPGALGLFLGTLAGRSAFPAAPFPLLLLIAAAAIWLCCGRTENAPLHLSLPRLGGAALAALFGAVCLRSCAGFLFSFPWKTGAWSAVFVLCVVLGKTAGGFLFDRAGGRGAALMSLIPAAALFLFAAHPLCGCIAVLLFNMTMPVTLRAAASLLPGAKGLSFGLLTFALFLGFLPAFFGLLPSSESGGVCAALSLLTLALLLPVLPKRA